MVLPDFFRGYDYATFASIYKNVPYYDHELTIDSDDLFRKQDDVFYVMDKVLEDYEFASKNVLVSDTKTGPDGQVITQGSLMLS